MIPKILHFIWFGDLKIPYNMINSWKEKHLDYKIHIWDKKNLFKLRNQKIFDETTKLNEKSDIARYEILYRCGGFYIDCDILCLKNIDALCNNEFFCLYEKQGLISNSVIGCTKNNYIIKNVFENLPDKIDTSLPVWKRTGPLFFMNYIKDKVTPFPYYYFNMCKDYSHSLLNKKFKITDDMISRLNKDIRNYFDENNIYGIQLWMGGKKYNYKNLLEVQNETIIDNLNMYISCVAKYRKKVV